MKSKVVNGRLVKMASDKQNFMKTLVSLLVSVKSLDKKAGFGSLGFLYFVNIG
jgi:hypothetical protein